MLDFSNNKIYLFIGVIIFIGALFFIFNTPSEIVVMETPASREWMEYAEDIVREAEPTPPESARLYAYLATAYFETLDSTKSSIEASIVVQNILDVIAPEYSETTKAKLKELTNSTEIVLSSEAMSITKRLLSRIETDKFTDVWDGERPVGDEFWTGTEPLSPNAKTWERWVVTNEDDFSVPPPPLWGSEEHRAATNIVKQAAIVRTPEQGAASNFWGGAPGTEAPAGIWQNSFFLETKDYQLTDQEYAYAQMVLAQGIADAFIECWEVKYTYWTKRPTMDDTTIDLGMSNPNFPSYVSGHSTISRAAAEVLSALFPEKRELWLAEAEEARDSRLWAGIHFEYDNDIGFDLGKAVGSVVVERLSVSPLR